ncbi:MAG: hypothetical protein ACJASB_003430 [Shewanella psychromarinicola]|jgi:hypothetical protein|uniref:hypothetical protein n=1 Tax=Shewanella psychromarinicola TaxID=2487742 RepID=UPI003EF0853A
MRRRQQPYKINSLARSKGQAMIEYVIITGVLVAALLTGLQDDDAGYAENEGYIGLSKNDDGSLLQALHRRYTAQAYALSLPEPPEVNSLDKLSAYYDRLGKFPELSNNLYEASVLMNKLTNNLKKVNDGIDRLEDYADSNKAIDKAKQLIDPDRIKDKIQDELEDQLKDQIKII